MEELGYVTVETCSRTSLLSYLETMYYFLVIVYVVLCRVC